MPLGFMAVASSTVSSWKGVSIIFEYLRTATRYTIGVRFLRLAAVEGTSTEWSKVSFFSVQPAGVLGSRPNLASVK